MFLSTVNNLKLWHWNEVYINISIFVGSIISIILILSLLGFAILNISKKKIKRTER